MKTTYIVLPKIFYLLIIGIASSCQSFVEVDLPKSQLTTESVFEDYNTAVAALTNIYTSIREKGILTGGQLGISNQLGNYADEITCVDNPSKASYNFYRNSLLPTNTYVTGYWNAAYNQIYAANLVIQGAKSSKNLTVQQKDQLEGEALFIRALLHFYLTNIFGDIPYATQTDYKQNSIISKTSVDQVYRLVVTDLHDASALLSSKDDNSGRLQPSVSAAQALLSRVYLYLKAYPEASNSASAVLNQSSEYKLENISNVFLISSSETIWQLQSELTGQNTADGAFFIFTSVPPPSVSLDSQLVSSFNAADLRKTNWIKSVTKGSQTYFHSYKYKEKDFTATSKEYAIVLRLAEQYLIRAEARAYQGDLIGAKEDLNKIRNRAGLNNVAAVTQQEILDAIHLERRWELFTEYGHRFFDLKRSGKLDSSLNGIKPGWNSSDALFPLPQNELTANPNLRPQNTGY